MVRELSDSVKAGISAPYLPVTNRKRLPDGPQPTTHQSWQRIKNAGSFARDPAKNKVYQLATEIARLTGRASLVIPPYPVAEALA